MNQEEDIFDLQAQLCQSIGHAARLRIVHALQEGPKAVNEIAISLGISQSTASRNLSILRSTGVLATHRKGSEIFYEIANPKVVEVCEMMRTILMERQAQFSEVVNSMKE